MRFPPNVDPKSFTLSAFIIGFALTDDLTANEQNSVGNWLILVGQVLEANSAQQQVIEERISGNTININEKKYKQEGNPYMHNQSLYGDGNNTTNTKNSTSPNDIDIIKKVLDKMQIEINNLTNKTKN